MNRAYGWLISWICLQPVFGQIPEMDERLLGIDPENSMQVEALEGYRIRLEEYRKHPLDLNRASGEALSELGLLTTMQIESWIGYRERLGRADSWYVLQGVPGWDWKTVERIMPYVQIGLQSDWKRFMRTHESAWHTWLFRWSTSSASIIPTQSVGDPSHQLIRYQFRTAVGLEAGWMMEKDPGESGRRPDFFSGYVQIRAPGRKSCWTIGDYSVQVGQGLIAWQGMSVASGADLVSLKKQGSLIRPYRSVGESRFMRGVGYSGMSNRLTWDVFVSRQKQTAVLYPMNSESWSFRSVDESGYHRTQTERSRKDDLTEYSVGGRLGIRFNRDRFNLNIIARGWDRFRMRLNDAVYGDTNYGRSLVNASLDYSLTRGNWHGFGECAWDGSGHRALVVGSMWVLHRNWEVGMHLRWIGRYYRTVDGEVLQERSGVGAEQGVRLQMRGRLTPTLTIDLYGDLFRIPTPHFQMPIPTMGSQYGWRLIYQPSKLRSIYLRLAMEDQEETMANNLLPFLVDVRQSSIRLHAQWDLDARFQCAFRSERTHRMADTGPAENGFLHYVELRYDPIGSRLQADLRFMWVDTDSWGTRIYAYERNVLHQVSFPAFSGSLIRSYLNLSWKWNRSRTVWFRWAAQKNIDNHILINKSRSIQHSFTLQFRLEIGSLGH